MALSNNYSAFFEEESVILDFLTYLMDAIPCLCDSVTVLVDLPKNNFQLVDGADRLLTKFETFLEKERYNMPHSVPVIQSKRCKVLRRHGRIGRRVLLRSKRDI